MEENHPLKKLKKKKVKLKRKINLHHLRIDMEKGLLFNKKLNKKNQLIQGDNLLRKNLQMKKPHHQDTDQLKNLKNINKLKNQMDYIVMEGTNDL